MGDGIAALAAFVNARLDEDEAAAVAAGENETAREWRVIPTHIGRHDPARALREVKAGRVFLNAAIAAWNYSCDPAGEYWPGIAPTMRALIKHQAAVWSDHPGYLQEWKP